MENEIIPGLSYTNPDDDLAEIRKDIVRREVAKSTEEAGAASRIIEECRAKYAKGIPVRITEEMRELGIDGKILEMAIAYAREQRMTKFFSDEPDDAPESDLF